ncbi:hypothetical protein [Paractinoplanes atraurantiacus]|nr:hypothetical protein [Actinoplanes atraurantiacus]
MLLAVVPQVDVVPDGFDWWNGLSGTGGFVAAIVAIVIAVRAQRTADQAVTTERRRVFELELLRELAKDLDNGLAERALKEPAVLRGYEFRLNLLSARLQSWDQLAAAGDFAEVMAAVGFENGGELQRRMADLTIAKSRLPDLIESSRSLINLMPASPSAIRLREQIAEFVSDVPTQAQPEVWGMITGQLRELLAEVETAQPEAVRRRDEVVDRALAEVQRRLRWDVQQAILARVEAQPGALGRPQSVGPRRPR